MSQTPISGERTQDNTAADELHEIAGYARNVVDTIIMVRYRWRALNTSLVVNDIRMMEDLLLEATINTAAIASLLARIEHKKRYPDAFLASELPT